MIKRKIYLGLLLSYWAASFFLVASAKASAELDVQFELGSIGALRSSDNMDDLFTNYLASAYKDYFSHQTRFILNDLSRMDETLENSKIPYNKIIMDRDILAQLAKSSHSQSILRTRVVKEGTQYYFTLDWLHVPHMELIGTTEFKIDDPSNGTSLVLQVIDKTVKESLNKLLGQVPFHGSITGRDGNSVTVNIGTVSGVKKGDILDISTLDQVKQHPLLKKIVEWKASSIGKIKVEQAEESISFCKILEEEAGRTISRNQKIWQIQSPAVAQPVGLLSDVTDRAASPSSPQVSRIGNINLSLFPAFYDRQYTILNGSSNSGGGVAYGAATSSEVLLTQEWFVGLDFKFSFLTFLQKDTITGTQSPASLTGGISETVFSYKINAGHLFLLNGSISGPKSWVKGGFKSEAYTMPVTTGENTGPISFDSFFLGVGADLPLRGNWGVIANLSFRLMTTVSQSWLEDSTNDSSDVELYLGGYYRINASSSMKLGVEVVSNGATFSAGNSLSQKTISIVPALIYYF